DALGARVVRQVDQHATRIARASQLAHLTALVEQVLQHLVGLQLDGIRLVHLPPQLLVALEAGGEAGLGEAVRHGGAVSRHGIKMTGSSLPSASPHPLHSKSSPLTSSPFGSPHPPLTSYPFESPPPLPPPVRTPSPPLPLTSYPFESPHPLTSPVRESSPP